MKKDTVAPKLISALPKKASTAIAKNENITLTFSEDIKLGTGTVTLSSENDVQTLSTSQFSINGSVVTIKPLHNLLPNSHYTLKIDKGTFEDLSGNQYAGINDIKTLFFDTIDTKAPQLKNTAAQNTTLATNANIVLTFDEPIKIGTGKITLNSEKDIRQISITDKQIKISGNTLTLNPTIDLNVASSYSLHIDAGAFKDSASAPNNSAAIDMTVNTSAKGDKQVPILQSYVDSKTANLSMQLNFQEAIKLGKGSFTLVDVANSKNKVVIPVTDSAQISIEKNVLSITPTKPLSPETQYSVTAPSGIIVDLSNNKFAGLTAKAPFVFDTHDKTPPTITLTDDKTEATHNLTLFEFNASEEIKEFTVDDITITGGTKGEFKQINPTHYTLAVTPNPNSTTPIKLAVAAEKFKDLVGNPNSVAVQSVQPVDTIAPTITIVDNKNTVASGPVLYVFTLSEPSIDFTADDINITDATKGEFTQRSQTLYTLSVTPKPNSTVPIKLAIAANTFTDLAGNSNTLAMQTVQEVDTASLTLSIEDDKTTVTNSPILYTFTLSAESNDFAVDDITVSGGIKGEFKAINPSNYTLSVTPEPNSTTPVSVNVAAGTFSNAAGSKNLAAEQHIQTIDTVSPLLKGSTPSNSAATVLLNSDITLVFNENILAGTGSFIISNGSESQTISVNDSKQIIINNNILTINPTQNFVANTEYSVTYSSGIVTDKVGNFFNTSNSPSSFTFKTTNATTSKDNVTQTQAFTDKLNARALDGYLKDATVFVDVNGDGIQNPGEASTITDAYGRFELPNTKGTLVVSGGIDLTTGKPFIGTLKAPEGSKVLTPLTTLQQGFVEIGQTPEQAEQSIAKAFGLELSKIDLLNYDPIEEIVKSTQTPSTQSNATKVMANSAQIANFLVTAGKALQGATGDSDNLSTQNTSEALVKSLVNAIEEDVKYDDGKIDLANTTLLKTVIVQGAKEANVLAQKEAQSQGITTSKFDTTIYFDKVDKMTDTVAQVLSASAEKVATIAQSDQAFDALSLLTKIDKVSAFTQNVAGTSLQNTIAINNKKDDAAFTLAVQEQANALTGNAATKAIDNQIVNTDNVVMNIENNSTSTENINTTTEIQNHEESIMSKIIKAKNSVNEGDEINFFVMGLKPNTSYAPKLGDEILKPGTKPCILDDIDPKSLNSVKSDASGFATFSIKLKSDVNTEGLESLSLIVDGTKSGVVNVYDTSKTPIKAVIPDKLKVIEGNNVNFTIGAPDGIYNYSFTGTVDKNDYKVTLKSDVVTESTVTIKDGTGSLTIAINNDSVLEDPETLILTLTPSGDIAGGASSFSCAPVTINEKSLGIPKLTSSSVSATEDNSVIFTLNEIAPGIYPYTLDIISTSESIKKTPLIYSGVYEDLGTPTVKNGSISITSSTSGTISVNENNTAINLTVPIQGDHFTESTEILTLTLGSPKLTIENNMLVSIVNGLTSSVVIKDTSVDYSYKLSVSTSTVNEGSSVVFNITDGKPNTTIGYKIKDYTPTTKNDFSVVANDFTVSQNGPVLLDLGSNVGNVTIGSDGKASFSIYVNADAIYDGNKVKAPEKFQVVLNDNANEPVDIIVVGTIPVVTINDTSFT